LNIDSLSPAPAEGEKDADNRATLNRSLRLLMRAYQALARDDLDQALALAAESSKLEPEIAAPHIVQGIALMKQDKGGSARVAFAKAKALDPGDSDIDRLLNAIP